MYRRALISVSTKHLGLDVDRAFRAFTGNTGTPHFPEGYFNILAGGEALAKNSAYVTITLIADLFLVRSISALLHKYTEDFLDLPMLRCMWK